MSERPEQSPAPQPEDAIERAYSDALTGGATDAFGHDLSAREVTSIDGVAIERVEQEARDKLAAVEKLRGKSEESGGEQRQAAEPEQPARPQQAESDEEPEELGSVEAARYLMGADEPTPEQAEVLAALEEEQALRSGEVAQEAVAADGKRQQALDQLEQECPGLTNDDTLAALERPWAMIRDRYGAEIAEQPQVIRTLYEAAGGAAKFGPDAPEQVAKTEQDAYTQALAGNGPTDSYGMPIESELPELADF